ncbi:MAG: S9 family peptidase [Proteobacteria bacterium]|nr:S9 family peptidase [Pseudomonadota bacterium]
MRLLMCGAVLAMTVTAGAQAATRSLVPEDLFEMQWASDPQIRGDGSEIVYVRSRNDVMTDSVVQSLWLVDVASGTETPLTRSAGHLGSPRWSPDGTRIAYLEADADGRMQIVVHWRRSGATAVVTHLTEAPADIAWSPDGKQIAFVMLERTAPPSIGKAPSKPAGAHWAPGPQVIDELNFRVDGAGLNPNGYRHLFVLSVEGGGMPRQLTFGPYSESGPLAWSPDGRYLYCAGNREPNWKRLPEDTARHTAMELSIFRVNVADGTLAQLSHALGPYHSPRVSPDGKQIAFLGFEERHVAYQNVRLNVMEADGSRPRVVGAGLDRALGDVRWAPDGRGFYVQYDDHGATKVARMTMDGHLETVASNLAGMFGPVQLPYTGGSFSVSDKGAVAFSGGGADELPDVYLAKDGKTRRITHLNADLFAAAAIGKLSVLPVKSSVDGREIDAWELLPPNFDPAKKYPLILEIHGGPYASYGPFFSVEDQLYAAAGYIVVYGNPRGSTSYGEEFANVIYNNYPSQDYDDLMSVVDAAIQRGNVDTDNLFVTGLSGGGVLTTWIVGKTHRFRAAATQHPVVNWTSTILTSDIGPVVGRDWFKHMPWEDPETYWKLSPISLIANVTTPTMVIIGLDDLRTPVGEAEQYYQALQLRGVPALLYEVPGAAHVRLTPSQLAQQQSAILEWFGRYRTSATR